MTSDSKSRQGEKYQETAATQSSHPHRAGIIKSKAPRSAQPGWREPPAGKGSAVTAPTSHAWRRSGSEGVCERQSESAGLSLLSPPLLAVSSSPSQPAAAGSQHSAELWLRHNFLSCPYNQVFLSSFLVYIFFISMLICFRRRTSMATLQLK